MGTRENKEQEPAKTTPEIMRTAVFLSLIAAARAFAPPSILRATVVVKNEADSASGFRYDNSDSVSPLEKKKALQDTASWCLERCIKLGHCEVFEDLNKMSTAQVQDFCKACVLTGEATQDECDVSMMFIEDGPWASIDRAAVGV